MKLDELRSQAAAMNVCGNVNEHVKFVANLYDAQLKNTDNSIDLCGYEVGSAIGKTKKSMMARIIDLAAGSKSSVSSQKAGRMLNAWLQTTEGEAGFLISDAGHKEHWIDEVLKTKTPSNAATIVQFIDIELLEKHYPVLERRMSEPDLAHNNFIAEYLREMLENECEVPGMWNHLMKLNGSALSVIDAMHNVCFSCSDFFVTQCVKQGGDFSKLYPVILSEVNFSTPMFDKEEPGPKETSLAGAALDRGYNDMVLAMLKQGLDYDAVHVLVGGKQRSLRDVNNAILEMDLGDEFDMNPRADAISAVNLAKAAISDIRSLGMQLAKGG